MGKVIWSFVALFGLMAAGCTRTLLSPADFTGELARSVQSATPGAAVEIVEPLELRIASRHGEFTAYLDNAYTSYKRLPDEKNEIVAKLVSSIAGAVGNSAPLDRSRIVPVLKSRDWLGARAAGNAGLIHDNFNQQLVVLYVEDRQGSVRFLAPKDLAQAGIARKDLSRLAVGNLLRMLPKVQSFNDQGLRGVIAGGDYEPSLLLVEGFWTEENFPVDGEVVVSVPTRNVLLVAGSEDDEAIVNMREVAASKFERGSSRLTPTLFVLRRGRFVEFDVPAGTAH